MRVAVRSTPLLENPLIKQWETTKNKGDQRSKRSSWWLVRDHAQWEISEGLMVMIWSGDRWEIRVVAIDGDGERWFDRRQQWFFSFDQMRKMESEVRVRAARDKEWEKITKILNTSVIVIVHVCTIIVAIVYLCTILLPLIWVFS